MFDIEDKIFNEYRILYNQGYENVSIENNNALFSSLKCVNETTGLIFYFSIEKGRVSITLTTNELLHQKEKVFFDFFYILKILYPKKNFEEIKLLSYPEEISTNLLNIENLFSKNQIDNTIKKINTVMKEYSKVRWKIK